MKSALRKVRWLCLLLAFAAGVSGCSTPAMKGTPFYTGEYKKYEGPVEDRVYVWPLLYYRKPVLSVLWPFVELSDEWFAVRPVFSVSRLDKPADQRKYCVLWPLAQFDRQSGDHRIFPAFWGKDYAVGFPLYWHFDHPFKSDGYGYDGLIPLWSYYRTPSGYSAYFPWPIIRAKNMGKEKGWHVWPLAGDYRNSHGRYSFACWPLGHMWSERDGSERGSTFIPLYFYERDSTGKVFVSLPYSFGQGNNGANWQCVMPLFYHSADDNESKVLSPLYFSGENKAQGTAWNMLLPLYYSDRTKDSRTVATLLGGVRTDKSGYRWLALPLLSGGSKGDGEGSVWIGGLLAHSAWDKESSSSHVLPLYYSERTKEGRLFATLLGGVESDKSGYSWLALPLLSGGSKGEGKGSFWIGGLLAHSSWDRESSSSHVLPLYYRAEDKSGSLFVSLPWCSGKGTDGSSWQMIPLAFHHSRNSDSETLITPLYSTGTKDGGKTSWNTVFPLYYRSRSDDSTFLATLFGGYQTDAEGKRWLVYPLLSGGKRTADSGDIWIVAPLFHAAWDKESASHHLLPLYYWDGKDRTFISMLTARWKEDDKQMTLVPPLLSLLESGDKTTDLWGLGGLMHFSWGREPGSQHVFPLFYADSREGTFVSPIAAKWRGDSKETTYMFPPGLSWLTAGKNRSDLWVIGPLAHFSWGKESGAQHVFPLFYGNHKEGTFVSPAWAKWRWGQGETTYMIPPALSWVTAGNDRSDMWVAGPLAHFSWGEKPGSQHIIPLFYRDKAEETFISLLAATWKDGNTKHWIYPPFLSSYSSDGQQKELTVLLGLMQEKWGGPERSGYLIPLYFHKGAKEFYTPIVGWNRNENDGFVYPLTPLIGIRTGNYTGGWLFPLFSHSRQKGSEYATGTFLWGSYWGDGKRGGSELLPIYGYKSSTFPGRAEAAKKSQYGVYGTSFWCLPACWYRNEVLTAPDVQAQKTGDKSAIVATKIKKNGFFPLWSYSSKRVPEKKKEDVDGSLLLMLYDYKHDVHPKDEEAAGTDDYVRSRVLWRLWHYERSNGDVTVDVFPAITYDRKEDGFKKISFLWRFFRYERGKDGRKLDLLFLPIMRAKNSGS